MRGSPSRLLTATLSLATLVLPAIPLLAPAESQAATRRRVAGSTVRGPARRPAQRAIRRVAPRPRPGIPWLRGNLPNVQAAGALVTDLQDGEELYSRNADTARPIASISKLAATLAVVDKLPLDGLTTMARIDAEVARGGARSRLVEGMILSNRDLLHAALLGSDNRAVSALGRAAGLQASELAGAMTRKARELGLKDTRFEDPTGLSPANVSTPREAIVLLRAVMDHPVLGPITRRMEYDARPVGRAPLRYTNTHRPAARANTMVLGGKTGFNNAARYCLVLAAEVGGRTLGMAFLGTEGELTRFGDVGRVSDWVVAYRSRRPSGSSSPDRTALAERTARPPAAIIPTTSAPSTAAATAAEATQSAIVPPPLPQLTPAAWDDVLPPSGFEPPPAPATPVGGSRDPRPTL